MSAQIIDYSAMLADLEAKKAVIDSAIASVRAAMAAGALGVAASDPLSSGASGSGGASSQPFDGDIPSGLFFGKSIPEAAKLYLSMVKRKQTTKEITSALEEGGMTTTADNFEATVTAGLFRASKKFGEIVKVKGSWGLAEWYKGMRVGPQEKKAPAKKKAKSRTKAKSKNTSAKSPAPQDPPEKETATTPHPGGPQTAIEECFQAHAGHELSTQEVSEGLNLRIQTVGLICSKLAARGILEKTSSGKFRMAKVHAMPKSA